MKLIYICEDCDREHWLNYKLKHADVDQCIDCGGDLHYWRSFPLPEQPPAELRTPSYLKYLERR